MKSFDVQESVISAAVELFARHGFGSTSVQQVVEVAGVTKGAMYHYFRSKDDLLFAIYEQLLTMQSEHLRAIIARDLSTAEKLRAACVDVIETSVDSLQELTVFFQSAHLLSEDRRKEVTQRRRAYNDEFAAIIETGQREGIYRTDIPRAVLIAHFFSDVHYLSNWFSPDGPEDKTLVAEQLTDLFIRSIIV
jgi:AcrR family transcriptional regulator